MNTFIQQRYTKCIQ